MTELQHPNGTHHERGASSFGIVVACTLSMLSAGVRAESPYAAQVRTDQPIGYWRFEEAPTATAAADEAGHQPGRCEQVQFGPPSGADVLGKAVRLGNSSQITITGLPAGGDLTLEWWHFAEATDGDRTLLSYATDSATCVVRSVKPKAERNRRRGPAKLVVTDGLNGPTVATSKLAMEPGRWYHVALVHDRDAGTWRLLINGFADAMGRHRHASLTSGSAQLVVGSTETASFRGRFDELAIYSAALSDDRIRAHYNAALASRRSLDGIEISAHRGNSMHAPENTIIAYTEAIAAGATLLEMDIQLSRDGIPMLLHDRTVDRTTDATGPIENFTAAQLTQLDAGKWKHPRYAGERIPTLEQAARAADRGTLVLDIKGSVGIGQAIAAALKRAEVDLDRVIAGPWNDEVAADIRKHLPGVRILHINSQPAEFDDAWFGRMKQAGYDGFWYSLRGLTQSFIEAAHRHEMPVYVWTLNDSASFSHAIFAGVDGIVTDDPAGLARTIEQLQP